VRHVACRLYCRSRPCSMLVVGRICARPRAGQGTSFSLMLRWDVVSSCRQHHRRPKDGFGDTAGAANRCQCLDRNFEITCDCQRISESARLAHAAQNPASSPKDALHPGIGYGNDIGEPSRKAKFNHAREQFICGAGDTVLSFRGVGRDVYGEPAAFPYRRT